MKNKDKQVLDILLLILILLLLFVGPIAYKIYKEFYSYEYLKFDKPMYITTRHESSNKKQNYKLNDNRKLHKINYDFTYDNKVYGIDDCYDSYISNNTVLNKLNKNRCNALEKYSDNKIIIEMIYEISHLEHDIFTAKIIKTNKNYYAVVSLNVNLWTPYNLYIYDKNTNSLKMIHQFDGEDVIAIKD